MNKEDVAKLRRYRDGGMIPPTLTILFSQSATPSRFQYTALSTQFSVDGRADTIEGALDRVVSNLLQYIETCQRMDAETLSYAGDPYLEAFDYGEEVELPESCRDLSDILDVRQPLPAHTPS